MPGLNHKGPQNEGPRTGRGLGDCNPRSSAPQQEEENTQRPGLANGMGRKRGNANGAGRGLGRGRGRGMNKNR
jgi:hypothetical protein